MGWEWMGPIREKILTTCHLLLATLRLTTYYLLLATCHLPLTTCHVPLATCHLPLTTHYLRLATYYLLLATCYLPLATCCLLLATCYLLLACHLGRVNLCLHLRERFVRTRCKCRFLASLSAAARAPWQWVVGGSELRVASSEW